MAEEKTIVDYEPILPEDFDGVFRFSNPTDEDFVGVWNGVGYTFPAQTTTPMVMPEFSPLEIQHIRKKFAKDLAEREFFKSKNYETFRGQEGTQNNRTLNSIHQAATYTLQDLEPTIQACLKPLAPSKLTKQQVPRQKVEERLHKNDDGEYITQAIDKKTSLRQKALES